MLVPEKRRLGRRLRSVVAPRCRRLARSYHQPWNRALAASGCWGLVTTEQSLLKTASITLLLFAHIVPLHARAEELGGVEVTAVERKACLPDVIRFCRPMMADMMAVFGCMKQKRDQLSSACDRIARARGL